MPEELPQLGCVLAPEPFDVPSIEPLLGAGELPDQYMVPSWRECFDENFNPIPDKIRPRILNQGAIDSCVGHGTAVQKSAQEGVAISPRDIWRVGKSIDGYPLSNFGTTLWACQDALIKTGAAEAALVAGEPAMGRDAYLAMEDITPEVHASREKHKSKSAYYVPRSAIRQTLLTYGFPLVTSSAWYAQDSAIGADGIMRPPSSPNWTGHAYACVGWVRRLVDGSSKQCLVMVNSFGPAWGAAGLFLIPLDGTENRLNNAYVAIDIEPSLAQVLANFNGRNVRRGADHWKIEGGRRRKYPDELVWWAHGNLFGYDVFEISAEELEVVPLGANMTIEEAPWKNRELIRQIRQHGGQA